LPGNLPKHGHFQDLFDQNHGLNYNGNGFIVELASPGKCGNITTLTSKQTLLIAIMHTKRILSIPLILIGLSFACTLETTRPDDISVEIIASETPAPPEVDTSSTGEEQPQPTSEPTNEPATPTLKPSSTPIATITPLVNVNNFIRVGPFDFPSDINPLTGLPVPNPALLERRPIVAKIPNYPHSVRPQSGITLADQIYEYYLEWDLTRFAAVFYGNDAARFGPLRSARVFDENLIRMYNAIFVFNGADQRVFKYYEKRELDPNYFVVERFCPPLCRDDSIPSYNNLFGNTAQVHEHITGWGLPDERHDLSGNFFSSAGGLDFKPGTEVFVTYSYANYAYWAYHEPSERYIRYQGTVDNVDGKSANYEMHMDAFTGQPLTVDNVIILLVPHSFFHKSSDTEFFQMDLTGSGEAYLFRDNKAYPARWHRFKERRPLAIIDLDGKPLALKPGVTFFQVMNSTSEVRQNDQTWFFDFARPPDPDN